MNLDCYWHSIDDGSMETLQYEYRFQYGNTRFYPKCQLSYEFCKLMRRTCFEKKEMHWLKKMGIPFEVHIEEFLPEDEEDRVEGVEYPDED